MSKKNTVYYPGCKGIWYSKTVIEDQLEYVLYEDATHYSWSRYDDVIGESINVVSRDWSECFESDPHYFLPTASLILPMEFLE